MPVRPDDVSEDLPELVRRLLAPPFWPQAATDPELIETHISWVVLAGDKAYKIKKPVLMSFVDFRALAARRVACHEELRLNRRLAPGIYEAVVPIGGTPDAPVLNAEPAIEFAVVMRRFPQTALLDAQLAAGRLTDADMRGAARMLADFHRSLEPTAPSSAFGSPDAVIRPFVDTMQDLAEEIRDRCPALPARLDRLHRRVWPLIADRKSSGFVRECHGDLHLRNLIKLDGRILAFDCLEFAPDLRWIDVANEAAFLFMDLDANDAPPLAWRFVNDYLQETGDYQSLSLLRYYAAYHAFVRAKIAKLAGDGAKMMRYLAAGERYLAERTGSMILMHGFSGSGKTTVSETLIGDLPAVRIRSDVERKRLAGLPPDAATDAAFGQGIYDDAGTARTYEHLLTQALPGVVAGNNVVVDAAFLKAWQRKMFVDAARASGFSAVLVDCVAEESVLRERVRRREASGRGISEARPDILERQLRQADALRDGEGVKRIPLDTASTGDAEALARRVRAGMGKTATARV